MIENKTNIPCSILVDGQTVEFPPILFVFAAALKGVDWAVKEAQTPEFERKMEEWRLGCLLKDAEEVLKTAQFELEKAEADRDSIIKKIEELKIKQLPYDLQESF